MNEFKNWFLQNSPREQLLLGVGGVVLLLTLLYAGVLMPLSKDRNKQLINNQSLLAQQQHVRELAAEVMAQEQGGGAQHASLAQVINTSLRNHSLRMEDFQPTGEQNVRVRLAKAEFNLVMAWLDELENKEGVQIKEVSVTADDVKGLLSTVTVKMYRN